MAFDIDKFISQVSGFGGFARSNHYEVFIPKPSVLGSEDNSRIPFIAESITTPGISLQTDDILHDGYTIVEKRPFQSAFTEIEIGFLLENDGRTQKFFEEWFDKIGKFSDRSASNFQMFMFPSEYMVDIDIVMYRSDGSQLKSWTLINSFPTILNGITMGYANQNEFARYTVTFAYERWKRNAT